MKRSVVTTMIVYLLAVSFAAPSVIAQPPAALERRELVIRDFRTESGAVLPEARLVYTTLGTLNAAGDAS